MTDTTRTAYSPHPLLGALLAHVFGDWRLASLDPVGWTTHRGAVFNVTCVFCGRHSQATATGLLEAPLCGCDSGRAKRRKARQNTSLALRARLTQRVSNWIRDYGCTWGSGPEGAQWILDNMNLPPEEELKNFNFTRPDGDKPWGPDNISLRPKTEVRRKVGKVARRKQREQEQGDE
mgnify:CR=1 FL=1|jgi:hypothetical protein